MYLTSITVKCVIIIIYDPEALGAQQYDTQCSLSTSTHYSAQY